MVTIEPYKFQYEIDAYETDDGYIRYYKVSKLTKILDRTLQRNKIKLKELKLNSYEDLMKIIPFVIETPIMFFYKKFAQINNINTDDVKSFTIYRQRAHGECVMYSIMSKSHIAMDLCAFHKIITYSPSKDAFRSVLSIDMHSIYSRLIWARVFYFQMKDGTERIFYYDCKSLRSEKIKSAINIFRNNCNDSMLTKEQHTELRYYGLMDLTKIVYMQDNKIVKVFDLEEDAIHK